MLERALLALARSLEPPVGFVLALRPIRRRLQRRALRAWRASDEPLIVCLGNINRSAFAAELARHGTCSRARSAGSYPMSDRPSPARTIEAAKALGVDLSAHRSVVLDRAAVAGAPTIFAFDLQNLAQLLIHWPRSLPRTHLLALLADSGPALIGDPHGRDRAVLDTTLAVIAGAIECADRRGPDRPSAGES